MNVLNHIPNKARLAIYIVYALLGPVLVYTASRGWTGEAEYTLWVGIGTAVGLTAAANINPPEQDDEPVEGESFE